MVEWVDTIVVTIIIATGLVIFYKALKEPLDLLFRGIGRVLGSARDKIIGVKDSGGDYYETIKYR